MRPTEEDFFSFVYQRQLIWHKRFQEKRDPPWTDDPIMQKYKIINMYRELDRCTIYLMGKLRGKDRKTQLANILFYRFFNRDSFYEDARIPLLRDLAPSTLRSVKQALDSRKARGERLFSDAYLISSGEKGEAKHTSVLNSLSKVDVDEMIEAIDKSKAPKEAFEILQIGMAGPFLACEFWTDLTYLGFFRQGWTDDDFVNVGPGAKWGLEIMYGKCDVNEKLHHLREAQKEMLRAGWIDIAYKDAASSYPWLSITNIEGALCEFRKYTRLSGGKGKRRLFTPASP